MKAVILVGGKGTRMHPLTFHLPKPMVPIGNVPFIERMVRWLADYGVDEVVLGMGYLPDAIQSHFEKSPVSGVAIRYVVEDHPLGTGGGIRNAARGLSGTILALNGDILTDMRIDEAVQLHRQNDARITIALTPVDDPTIYGVVESDVAGRIERFTEKPRPEEVRSNFINAGLYVMEAEALDEIPDGVEYSVERRLFPDMLARGERLFAYKAAHAYWLDIGTPAKYLQANSDLLEQRIRGEPVGTRREGSVWIGDKCRIERATLIGPCALGNSCVLEAGARVGPGAVIGDNVVVGANSSIHSSVIWSGTKIGAQAHIEGSILGRNCRVADGANIKCGGVMEDGTRVGG